MAKAVRLATEGLSLRAIGAKVGKDHKTVREALDREYQERKPSDEEVKLARSLKSERLYRHLAAWAPRSVKGDPQAALAVVRIEKLISDLEGTDAPKTPENVLNVSAVATTSADTTIEVGPEVAARLVRELFGNAAATPTDEPSPTPDRADDPANARGAGEVPEGTP